MRDVVCPAACGAAQRNARVWLDEDHHVFERVLQRKRLLETGPGYESRAERIRKAIESKMVSLDEEVLCC